MLGPGSNAHGPNEMLQLTFVKKLICCLTQIVHKTSANYCKKKWEKKNINGDEKQNIFMGFLNYEIAQNKYATHIEIFYILKYFSLKNPTENCFKQGLII